MKSLGELSLNVIKKENQTLYKSIINNQSNITNIPEIKKKRYMEELSKIWKKN